MGAVAGLEPPEPVGVDPGPFGDLGHGHACGQPQGL